MQNRKTEINVFGSKILMGGPQKLGTEIFMHK